MSGGPEKRPEPDQTQEAIQLLQEVVPGFAETLGLEVVEISVTGRRKPRVQIFVDTPEGVTAGHCAGLSRKISRWIEEEHPDDLFAGPYQLEVSSPGLDRPFKKVEDYQRNAGRRIQVQLKEALKGGKETFRGKLCEVLPEAFEIELDDGSKRRFEYQEVRKVHQSIEF